MLSLVASQFKKLISDHALLVVSKLNASPSQTSNDLLASLLRLGDGRAPLAPVLSVGNCPPDSLDVSTLALFRETSSSQASSHSADEEIDSTVKSAPDVLITFASGQSFRAHSAILSARSRFFEKAIQYHAPQHLAGNLRHPFDQYAYFSLLSLFVVSL